MSELDFLKGKSKYEIAQIVKPIQAAQRKVIASKVPEFATERQMNFVVAAIETVWLQHKRLITWEELLTLVGISGLKKGNLRKILKSPELRARLYPRGIYWPKNWREESNEVFKPITPQQLLAIQIVTDPTAKGSLSSRLSAVGINYAVYRNWLKQPHFAAALKDISENMIQDNVATVHNSLVKKAEAGDTSAMKLFYEISGRHDPTRQQNLDLAQVIGLLLDVITRHVTDIGAVSKITDEFEKVIKGEIIEDGTSALKELEPSPAPDVIDAEEVVDEIPPGFFEL